MFDPSKYTVAMPKPIPVILLLDVSGSMREVIDIENARRTGEFFFEDGQEWERVEGGTMKLTLMNQAVSKMLDSFRKEVRREVGFMLSIITFGSQASVHTPPTDVTALEWKNFEAEGETALGAALNLSKKMIEDKSIIPSRAYRPTIVLVSDGEPTDDWEEPMRRFVSEGRSSKCFCMAMGIGEADDNVLRKFISGTPTLAQSASGLIPNEVFHADDAEGIKDFFQRVTMSVTTRSRSANPNAVPESIPHSSEKESTGVYF